MSAQLLRPLISWFLCVGLGMGMGVVGLTVPASAATTPAVASPGHLTVGQLAAPVDVENLTGPLLGWQVAQGTQTAYQVQVATTRDGVPGADVWDSGKVTSTQNANIAYSGPALTASSGYYWRVRTWSAADAASDWSAVSHFGTGPGSTWSDAAPIWTPGVSSGWADYTYEGTFNITGVAASVNFRAKDSANFYMWQFRASDAAADPSTLKTHANVNNSFTPLEISALPFALTKATDYDFRIVVNGSSISTYLRPSGGGAFTFVNSIDNASFTAGGIGFRTGSTESAVYDNLKVTDPTGKVLYANDFSTPNTDFTCGTVSGGRLSIGTSRNCNYGVDWQNYAAQATFTITQNTAAMSLKGTDTSNFYLWQLKVGNPGTVQINKNVAGTFTTLKTVTLGKPIVTGTDYVLKVVALGNTYQTYVDGVLVDTMTDATHSTGRVGFRTGGFETFKVKNLTVTTPDGQAFYSNSFPTGNTDFSCGTVASNTLTVPINANCLVAAPTTNWAFLRGDVDLQTGKQIAWAHLFATGGSTNGGRQYVYKMWLNGQYVGIGPTRPIGSETRYDGYDVTSMLRPGARNTIGALAYTTSDQRYLAQLVVRYTDGTTQTFGTGPSWRTLNGSSALPDAGSIGTSYYAAPKENFTSANYPFGFDSPGFDDAAWKAPVVKTAFSQLTATPTAKVERQLRAPASVVEFSPGNYFIDYGRTWVGGLSTDFVGTAGQAVDIRYGEVTSASNTVKYATDGGNNYQDVWTLKAGRQHLETWGMRVFRYVNVLNAPTGLKAADFPAEAYVYPYDASAGVFESSNSDLNQVWALNKNTIEATNGNLYVDSWERERGAYEADSYLQMMANFYTSSDPTLGNYSIAYLFKQRTWPTEWPIYIILAMHDSYAQTGDIDALKTYYTALQGKLPDRWFEESSGLIRKTGGSNGAGSCTDCDIVDWPGAERDGYVFTQYNTVINAISFRAYEDMAEIATALGKSGDATAYRAKAARIKAATNAKMWDSTKGAYRDGLAADQTPTNHWAVQASVFATAFGLADDDQAARVATYLGDREAASPDGLPCSVYCSAFVFETLYNGDRGDIAMDLLTSTKKRTYLNMIRAGAGATAEAWDKSLKANLTYSHPWAASIAYNMPQGMFGIKPTTAGYDTFDVKPQADSLTWAHVTVPTLKGSIGAAFDKGARGTEVGVQVPANSQARISVPGATPATTTVYVDGRATPATYVDGYARVDAVAPGCHVLSLAPGTAAGSNTRLTGICPAGWTAPLDQTAPTVTATTDPAAPTGLAGWFTGPATLTLAAADAESAVASVEIRTDDGDWRAYTTPVEAPEGTTTYRYRATDAAGNISATGTTTVKRDATAPTMTATTAPAAPTGALGWFTGPASLVLTATDTGSGVATIEVRTGDGDWRDYTAPVEAPEGTTTYRYRATDAAGNISATGTTTVKRDATAPTVTAAYDDQDGKAEGPITVTLTAQDTGSGIDATTWSLDGSASSTYDQAITVQGAGTHQLTFQTTDTAGNSSTLGTATIVLAGPDTTAPTVTATTDPAAPTGALGWFTGPASLVLTATDTGSGVATIEVRTGNGDWRAYTTPVEAPEGTTTYAFRATDQRGNTSTIETTTIKRDTTAPTMTATTDPAAPTGPAGWFTGPATLTLAATDTGSGVATIEVRTGDGDWRDYTTPVEAPEGTTTYRYRATDAAGNISATGTTTVKRDATAPTMTATTAPAAPTGALGWFTGPASLVLTATDTGSGVATIEVRTGDGDWRDYTAPIEAPEGTTTYRYRATDAAGNISATGTTTVKRDATAPTVTAAYDDQDGKAEGPITVTLTAQDTGSGIDATTWSLDGSASSTYDQAITVQGAGTHQLTFQTTDTAGNSSTLGTATIVLAGPDTTAPTVTATTDPAAPTGALGWFTGPASLVLTATDTGSGVATIEVRTGNGDWRAYTTPVEAPEGTTTYAFRATDQRGNTSTIETTTIKRDTTAPTMTATTDPAAPTGPAGWFTGPATLTLAATDTGSGVATIEVRTGDGDWRDYTTPVEAPEGTTTYRYRATDAAGNISATGTTTVKRDATAPTVTAAYDDQDGKAEGPITVTLTAQDTGSGIDATTWSLDGSASSTYDQAITVQGAGTHQLTFQTTDTAGNSSTLGTATIVLAGPDTTAPTVTATTDPAAPTGPAGWFTGPATLTLAATDTGSGVATIEVRTGNGDWRAYTTPVEAPEGTTTYAFRATDQRGNTSTIETTTIKRDTTAPTMTATTDPAAPTGLAGWFTGPASLVLTATDTGSGVATIEVRTGDGDWRAYTAPVEAPEGTTTYRYRATDAAGNISATGTTTVKRDATAPTMTATTAPAAPTGALGWFTGPASLVLTATDTGSGVATIEVRTGNGDWRTYTAPVEAPEGTTTYRYRATDAAGNISATGTTTVKRDATAPTMTATTAPAAPTGALGWFTGPATLTLAATDTGSAVASVEIRTGDGDWRTYTTPVEAPEGTTTYHYRATDAAGNISATGTTTVKRDATAPTVTAAYDDQDGTAEGPITVTLTAQDTGSGVSSLSYRVDSGTWAAYDGTVQVTGAGTHVVDFSAADVAGNLSEAGSVTVRIAAPDTTAPVVSAVTTPGVPTGPDGWFTAPVSVQLSAADERSAIGSIEYTLDSGPWLTYTGPVDIAEGRREVRYRATDTRGNISETGLLLVRRDQSAPVTTASYDDRDGAAEGPVDVSLVSTDTGSGVASVRYSVDGGPETTYTGPFPVTGSGATVAFHAVDVVGNVEQTQTATVRLTLPDTAPPVVTASTTPASPSGARGWFTGPAGLALTAVDDRSGMASLEIRVATGDWTAYTGPVDAPVGSTTYGFRATDGRGNVSAAGSVTIKRDVSAPVSMATYRDGDGTSTAPVAVTFAATDEVSGVEAISHRVDQGAWATGDAVTVSGNGTHTVDWYATDQAGNQEAVHRATIVIGRDAAGPVLKAVPSPLMPDGTNGWYAGAVTMGLEATDPSGVATREYSVDSGPWQAWSAPLTVPAGRTSYRFRATDALGNSSQVAATILRDDAPPVSTASYDDRSGTTTAPVLVTLAATDSLSGLADIGWSLDGGPWRAYSGPISVQGAGAHVVRWAAVDLAGNVESVRSATVRIAAPDTTAPSIAVTMGPVAPERGGWFTGPVDINVSATDASGPSRVEYRIGEGAWLPWSRNLVFPPGITVVHLRAIDAFGNVSAVDTRTVRRDDTAPRVRARVARPGSATVVRLAGRDAESGVATLRYRVDGGRWRTYREPLRLTDIGLHRVQFEAVNEAGMTSNRRARLVRVRG